MKAILFFTKNKYRLGLLCLFTIIISSCMVPIPTPKEGLIMQISPQEYDVYDKTAKNIFTYQKEKAEQNKIFLSTFEKHIQTHPEKKEWYNKAITAVEIGEEMIRSTQNVWNKIVDASGGQDMEGNPLGADQKVPANKILNDQHKSVELQRQLNDTKSRWLALLSKEDQVIYENQFSDVFKSKDWIDDNTFNLKIGVLQLSFANLLFEVENQQTNLLKFIWQKMDSPVIEINQFEIMSSIENPYVAKGERFRASVFLAPVYQPNGDDYKITINGRRMPLEDGIADYVCTTPKVGNMDYKVTASYTDPLTGEVTSQRKDFKYIVGEEAAAHVYADKMNVVYIGVDNPISITIPGVDMNNVKVTTGGGGGASIKRQKKGQYILRVTRPAPFGQECEIRISANGTQKIAKFRVKRIPDPVAKLGRSMGGAMGVGEFKAQAGVMAVLETFDFDARCKIQGFILTHAPKVGTRADEINRGARYSDETKALIQKGKPGDLYLYDNVKVKCPGDPAGRKINSMVFKIK